MYEEGSSNVEIKYFKYNRYAVNCTSYNELLLPNIITVIIDVLIENGLVNAKGCKGQNDAKLFAWLIENQISLG